MKNIIHKVAPIFLLSFILMSMQSQTGIKSYKANLTQSSTDAPVATVLENDFSAIGTLTWGYTSAGIYTLTASAPMFTSGKTRARLSTVSGVDPGIVITSTTVLTITVRDNAGAVANALLTNSAFDLEVWN